MKIHNNYVGADVHGVCLTLTTPTGAFWLNVGYVPLAGRGEAVPLPYLLWDKAPFFLMQEVVWNYGAGVGCRNSFSPRNETATHVRDPDHAPVAAAGARRSGLRCGDQKKNGACARRAR